MVRARSCRAGLERENARPQCEYDRYSVLHDNDHLFAAKYKLCLPSEDELREEIENQKLIFRLQHGNGAK